MVRVSRESLMETRSVASWATLGKDTLSLTCLQNSQPYRGATQENQVGETRPAAPGILQGCQSSASHSGVQDLGLQVSHILNSVGRGNSVPHRKCGYFVMPRLLVQGNIAQAVCGQHQSTALSACGDCGRSDKARTVLHEADAMRRRQTCCIRCWPSASAFCLPVRRFAFSVARAAFSEAWRCASRC